MFISDYVNLGNFSFVLNNWVKGHSVLFNFSKRVFGDSLYCFFVNVPLISTLTFIFLAIYYHIEVRFCFSKLLSHIFMSLLQLQELRTANFSLRTDFNVYKQFSYIVFIFIEFQENFNFFLISSLIHSRETPYSTPSSQMH